MPPRFIIRWPVVILLCIQQLNSVAQYRERKLYLMDSLLEAVKHQKEDSVKAETLRRIGTIKIDLAQNSGNWDDPINWTNKALNLSLRSNYQFGIGRCYWQLGVCYKFKGDFSEAVRNFSEAIKVATRNKNLNLKNAADLYLAQCYMSLGRYREVISIGKSAIGYPGGINTASVNADHFISLIANASAALRNFKESMMWFEKLLQNHTLISEAQIRLGMAAVQVQMECYEEAIANYNIALKLLDDEVEKKSRPEAEFMGLTGSLLRQIGEVYFKVGSIRQDTSKGSYFRKAEFYLDKSLPLLQNEAAGKEILLATYDLLKQVCEYLNDYKKALHFSQMYSRLNDSLFNKETYQKLADQQLKFQMERSAAEAFAREQLTRMQDAKLLADQKLKQEKELAEEKITHERIIAVQKLNTEKQMAMERTKRERLRLEKERLRYIWLTAFVFMVISAALIFLIARQKQMKKRTIERAQAFHKMAELEMQSLRAQLNPHFMFNSLNSIQTLVLKKEYQESQNYLSTFSKLLRMLLENAEKSFVTLDYEIDFIRLYLSLEKLRMPDLQYSISVDPSITTPLTLVPNMILQPYIENAIWHGLYYKENNKALEIRISNDRGSVVYEIKDNGVGRKKAEELKSLFRKQHQSKGMELLNKRFKLLSAEFNSSIEAGVEDVMENGNIAGTVVKIRVTPKFTYNVTI